MEAFIRIKNPFILQNDPNNRLKTIVSVKGENYGSKVYGHRYRIEAPKKHNKLAQVYLQLDVTNISEAESLTAETGFAAKVMSLINWKTLSGTSLQLITPEYTMMRLDEFSRSSSVFERIEAGMTPPTTFTTYVAPVEADPMVVPPVEEVEEVMTSGACTLYYPLFLFISEQKESFLDTRHLEQTYFELSTAETSRELGFYYNVDQEPVPLTSVVPTLHFLYFDDNETSLNDIYPNTKKSGIPKQLFNSYNTFYEDVITVPTGATMVKHLLRCNFPLYNVHAFLINSNSTRRTINRISLSIKKNYILRDFPNHLNYTFFASDKGYATEEAFSYWFSDEESRTSGSGLITFSSDDSFYPSYLELSFNAVPEGCSVHIFSDYKTVHNVTEEGRVLENENGGVLQMKSNYY